MIKSYFEWLMENVESDLEQRSEARRIFDNIQSFLTNNYNKETDHIDGSWFIKNNVGGFTFLYFSIDPKYPKLVFQFNPTSDKLRGGFGQAGEYSVIVINMLQSEYNDKYINTRIYGNKQVIIHEIIHYLDMLRYKSDHKVNTVELFNSGKLSDHFNDPSEFNAYFQEIIEDSLNWLTNKNFNDVRLHILNKYGNMDYKSFRDDLVLEKYKGIYDMFDEETKKRFNKRLYSYYIDMKNKRNQYDKEIKSL